MRQLTEISRERDVMGTMRELTGAFEGIASMRIAQIKDLVQQSENYFGDLWLIYNQLRVDELFHFGRSHMFESVMNKDLLILITSEGSFSGDIDQRLVDDALEYYDPDKNDIIVIGHHGSVQLLQKGIRYTHSFKMPEKERNFNVAPIVAEVQKYASTTVYYQTYISLMTQEVKSIPLGKAVTERGKSVKTGSDEIISEQTYIFEPSTYAVVDHLERSMMQITLSEVILESKLAQYASRFRAMSAAQDKARESLEELDLSYNRAKRLLKDERLKEVINGLRKATL